MWFSFFTGNVIQKTKVKKFAPTPEVLVETQELGQNDAIKYK